MPGSPSGLEADVMSKPVYLLLALLGVSLSFVGGYYVARHAAHSAHDQDPVVAAAPVASEQAATPAAQWVCPMHPHIHQDQPGSCPICGMHLVAAEPPSTTTEPHPDAHQAGHSNDHDHDHEHDQDVGHGHEHEHEAGHGVAVVGAADASRRLQDPAAGKPLWICPMHAQIQQDQPGRCPICGMDLVPHVEAAAQGAADGVVVDTALQQRLGVRLVTAQRRQLGRVIRTWGSVALDESALFEVSPKIDGWLRKLHVSAAGQTVREGQPLYELYSPDLVQRQREYIEVMRRGDTLRESVGMVAGQNAQMLASLARERMRLRQQFENADIDKDFIQRMEKYRRTVDVVVIRATRSGVVTRIGAREGSYITPQSSVVSLADLSRVWIDIALYPDPSGSVSAGDAVTATPQDGSGVELRGRLQLPKTAIDPRSRSQRGRLVADNPGQRLLPGSYLDVRIAAATREVLAVPRSALVPDGRGMHVIRARGDGRFMPVAVQTGAMDELYVEIVSGLDAGDEVVAKGQFLLDAAASLQAAAERMREGP